MAPVALVGVVAAISIPAFMKYRSRSQEIENLDSLPTPMPEPQ